MSTQKKNHFSVNEPNGRASDFVVENNEGVFIIIVRLHDAAIWPA